VPLEIPSPKYLIGIGLYLILDVWLGYRTKYRSLAVTAITIAILFALSIILMLVLKLKEKLWKTKN
jgi:hypothetical protein